MLPAFLRHRRAAAGVAAALASTTFYEMVGASATCESATAAASSSASSSAPQAAHAAPRDKLNQPAGRPQSLADWYMAPEGSQDGSDYWAVRRDAPGERYRAPDGGNRVHGVPHPPFIREENWDR
jgi:hypothetical protein